jgi:hypothetical protein
MPTVLVSGLLYLAILVGNSHANMMVLAGSAVTPVAAIAAAAVRWLPDSASSTFALPCPPLESDPLDFAGRFPETECGRWMQAAHAPGCAAVEMDHPVESFKLLRAGTGNYHAYQAPTTLHTGYGCMFDEETWRLSRASRQGLEEPSHFYLKLTFRF